MVSTRAMKVMAKEESSPPREWDTLLMDSRQRQAITRNSDPCKVNGSVVAVLLVILVVVGAVSFNSLISSNTVGAPNSRHSKSIFLGLEGKHHASDDNDDEGKLFECTDKAYASRTLQLAFELPFASLFKDNKGNRKFEASSVTLSDDNKFAYAICDSSWAIYKFGIQLTPFADDNLLIGDVDKEADEDSGYEAIVLYDETFYVVRESVDHELLDGNLDGYHAIIEELQIVDKAHRSIRKCSAEFEFEGDSKGFEGAAGLKDLDGNLVILALCEGNHCSQSKKDDIGNGRIVVMKQEISTDGTCLWKTIRTLHLPRSAAFLDYSAISITASGKVGVSSQENSQFWVSRLLGQQDDGRWDIDMLGFDHSDVAVYDFPKDNMCTTVYCNIEGIHWINDDMVIAVSDKMKGHGKQDFRCSEKDQSVHVFMLPD